MSSELYLTIDIGTGSVRAALVDRSGTVLHIASREHEQIVPAFGWSEQRPADWWAGVVHVVREAIGFIDGAAARIAVVCACGQNHGTVLIDKAGALTRTAAPLWNDKRTTDLVAAFEAKHRPETYLAESGNPPATAWPAFKLQWLRDNDRRAYDAAATVLMPKDYVNFRLTGERAMDLTSRVAELHDESDHEPMVAHHAGIPRCRPGKAPADPSFGRSARARHRDSGAGDRAAGGAAGVGGRRRLPGGAARLRGVAPWYWLGHDWHVVDPHADVGTANPDSESATSSPRRGCGATSCCWRRAATPCAGRVGLFTITR